MVDNSRLKRPNRYTPMVEYLSTSSKPNTVSAYTHATDISITLRGQLFPGSRLYAAVMQSSEEYGNVYCPFLSFDCGFPINLNIMHEDENDGELDPILD